jgi:hypothetical protein
MFEQRPGRNEDSLKDIWGKMTPDRRNSKCKAPSVGLCFVYCFIESPHVLLIAITYLYVSLFYESLPPPLNCEISFERRLLIFYSTVFLGSIA